MNKKTLAWLAIAAASLFCFAASWKLFSTAFPLLNIEITMSRDAALKAASAKAAALRLAPPAARAAARFADDGTAQNFVELEGGGKGAYLRLLKQDVYQALKWEVRFFREKDPAAATLYFTPGGKPYGFTREVPEAEPGPALPADAACRLAESAALRDWGLDLDPARSPYDLVEKSFETRPNGRVDHTFVYERRDQRLGKKGEGRIRLTLEVAGERLSALRHWMLVPESFNRRFAEMRSANTTIALTDSLAVALIYLLGGCIGGLLLLKRRHALIVRPALKWAAFIAFLQGAALLNQVPLEWFGYDTAVSAADFLVQHALKAAAVFIGMGLLLAVSFMSAEGLSRRAFPHQPQLWKLWTTGAGNSWGVLGRTAGGYLWVGFDLLFIVVFYYLTEHYLGWWSPMESLTDPNVLATPLPWLSAVANALQAGFWEESLFRAVPLAGAALIGDYAARRFGGRLGGRKTWLAIGLVVEALIFGCAHANYPNQPSYARPVELFLPSLAWGLIYLRYGLLPGIVFHYLFDLLLMSLPIFALSSPELNLDRAIVILCGAAPLLAVIWTRLRAGRWQALDGKLLNAAWERTVPPPPQAALAPAAAGGKLWIRVRTALPWLGTAGLALWIAFGHFRQDGLPLYIDRAQAEAAADAALAARGVKPAEWRRFSAVRQNHDESDKFIWQQGGAAYRMLLGAYLPPPAWEVRYQRFDGDVVARAEKWTVVVENGIDGTGGSEAAPHVRGIDHELPESAPGAALDADGARALVRRALASRFGPAAAGLREIAAVQAQRTARRDWRFTFADDAAYARTGIKTGEARIDVSLAGADIAAIDRYVHVPEEWSRDQREHDAMLHNIKTVVTALGFLLAAGIVIAALMRAAHGEIDKRRFILVAAVCFVLSLAAALNSWETFAMRLDTQQPLAAQLWTLGSAAVIGLLFVALLTGLLAGVATHPRQRDRLGAARFAPLLPHALALAALWNGVSTLLKSYDTGAPYWESVSALDAAHPLLSAAAGTLPGALMRLGQASLLLALIQEFSAGFTRRRLAALLLLLPLGLAGGAQAGDMNSFLLQAFGNTAFLIAMYLLVGRFQPKLMLFAMMPSLFSPIVSAAIAAYPHALAHTCLTLAAIAAAAAWWMTQLKHDAPDPQKEGNDSPAAQ